MLEDACSENNSQDGGNKEQKYNNNMKSENKRNIMVVSHVNKFRFRRRKKY